MPERKVRSGTIYLKEDSWVMTDQKTDFETLTQMIRDFWLNMPFNIFLGMEIVSLGEDEVSLKFEMKDEFVGNNMQGSMLHGGIIASILDNTGGIIASASILKALADLPFEKIRNIFSKGGTIDLRVDYLRAGLGKTFQAKGSVLRRGRKVVVTRMELRNDQDLLIAVGTGTYFIA